MFQNRFQNEHPDPELVRRYQTKEASSFFGMTPLHMGMAPTSALVTFALLRALQSREREHQHRERERPAPKPVPTKERVEDAHEDDRPFLQAEAARQRPPIARYLYTQAPRLIPASDPGSDSLGKPVDTSFDKLPVGWDTGTVRLASLREEQIAEGGKMLARSELGQKLAASMAQSVSSATKGVGSSLSLNSSTPRVPTNPATPKMPATPKIQAMPRSNISPVNSGLPTGPKPLPQPPAPATPVPPAATLSTTSVSPPSMGGPGTDKVAMRMLPGLALGGTGLMLGAAALKGTNRALAYLSDEPDAKENYRRRISGNIGVPTQSNPYGVALI